MNGFSKPNPFATAATTANPFAKATPAPAFGQPAASAFQQPPMSAFGSQAKPTFSGGFPKAQTTTPNFNAAAAPFKPSPQKQGFQQNNGFKQQSPGFQQQRPGQTVQKTPPTGPNGFQRPGPNGAQQPRPAQVFNNKFQQNRGGQPPQGPKGFQTQQANGFQQNRGGQAMSKSQGLPQSAGSPSGGQDLNAFDDNDLLAALKTNKGRELSGTFTDMQARRAAERKKSIAAGLVDDPDNPKPLHMAIEFVGTCRNKCPSHEIVERCYQNMVDSLEMDPVSRIPEPTRFVKRFHRPAAGIDSPLPRDVRTPQALKNTMEYLVRDVLTNNQLETAHGFVRDRTRGIRQDFVYQNYRLDEAIECHETIARFHILSLHHLCGASTFDAFQEMEQLRKTLTSLAEYYRDAAMNGRFYPNEPEFRAYAVVLLARERDVERLVSEWPEHVRESRPVNLAVNFYRMLQRNSAPPGVKRIGYPELVHSTPVTFFSLVRSQATPYLMACLLEFHFGDVRRSGMNMINRSYNNKTKKPTLELVTFLLAYETIDEAREDILAHGLEIKTVMMDGRNTEVLFPNKALTAERKAAKSDQKFHRMLVEDKRGDRSVSDVLLKPHKAPRITPVPESDNSSRSTFKFIPTVGSEQDFSNFLNDSTIAKLMPVVQATNVSDNKRVQVIEGDNDFGMAALKKSTQGRPVGKNAIFDRAALTSNIPAPAVGGSAPSFGQTVQKPAFTTPSASTNTASVSAGASISFSPTPAPGTNGFATTAAPPVQPTPQSTFQTIKPGEAPSPFTAPAVPSSTFFSTPTASPGVGLAPSASSEKPASSWFPATTSASAVPSAPAPTSSGSAFFPKPAGFQGSPIVPQSSGTKEPPPFTQSAKSPTPSIFSSPQPAVDSPKAPVQSSTSFFNTPSSSVSSAFPSATIPATTISQPAFSAPPPSIPGPVSTTPTVTPPTSFEVAPASFTPHSRPAAEASTTPPTPPQMPAFKFKSPVAPVQQASGALKEAVGREKTPAEIPLPPSPDPRKSELEESERKAKRRQLERSFYTWLRKANRLRRLKMAAEAKRRKSNVQVVNQWWPICASQVPADKIQACSVRVFKPADTEIWFPEIVDQALQTIGVKNRSWKLILHNADWSGESTYWWQQKFLQGQDSITIPLQNNNSFQAQTTLVEADLEEVGALIYGCSADFSYSNEERFNHDRKQLRKMIEVITQKSKYSRLVVMALCYRSPLDETPADPLAADFTRTIGEGRNRRIEAVKSALGFHKLPAEVVGCEVIMLETMRDMELSSALRGLAEKYVLSTVNPQYAEEIGASPPPPPLPPPTPQQQQQQQQHDQAKNSPQTKSSPRFKKPAPVAHSNRGNGFIARVKAAAAARSASPSSSATHSQSGTTRKRPPPTSTPNTKRARPSSVVTPQPPMVQVQKDSQYKLLGLVLPRQKIVTVQEREQERVRKAEVREEDAKRRKREQEEEVRRIVEGAMEVSRMASQVEG